MSAKMIIHDEEILNFQDRVEKYRNEFTKRSHGQELPLVKVKGTFKKNLERTVKVSDQFFVSIPVKNQEDNIIEVLITLLANSDYPLVIGLLFDNCDDQSFQKCKAFFENSFYGHNNLNQVYFIESYGELFESTCENILLLFCKEKYFVSLQADILLDDKTFFSRSIASFNKLSNLLGISGRAVVPFRQISRIQNFFTKILRVNNYIKKIFLPSGKYRELGPYIRGVGYFGDISNMPTIKMNYSKRQQNKLYIGDAIIRGPIIWNSELLLNLNGFNDISYYLGRDDCDVCFRGSKLGYVVGYLPSTSYSFPIWGTTRKQRTKKVDDAIYAREMLAASNPGLLTLEWSRKRYLGWHLGSERKNRCNQNTISL